MRLFFALPLPVDIRLLLTGYIESQKRLFPELRWVDPSIVHLTLRFLGDVSADEPQKALAALGSVPGGSSRFRIDTCGTFPGRGKLPGVYWLGGGFPPWVGSMADKLAVLVDERGRTERAGCFTPHLSVARQGRHVGTARLAAPGPWEGTFEEIVLCNSILTPSGPVYERVAGVTLTCP
jgi:2'-5' RNA ligase